MEQQVPMVQIFSYKAIEVPAAGANAERVQAFENQVNAAADKGHCAAVLTVGSWLLLGKIVRFDQVMPDVRSLVVPVGAIPTRRQ